MVPQSEVLQNKVGSDDVFRPLYSEGKEAAVSTFANLAEEAKLASAEVNAPGQAILSVCKSLIAGGVAGGVSRTAVAPLERLKILLQVQNPLNPKYNGMVQGLRYIWNTEGVRGFFKGNGTNCARIIPNSAVKFYSYEQASSWYRRAIINVIQLLELESERNAVAVILHGFGGIGKTTLADAIFARLEIKDCKFSTVRLFEDIESKPDITKLQTWILQDLEGRSDIDIRRFEDGQRALRVIFEKQEAFLYIDNALNNDALEKLLPMNLDKCKKLRLLLTARNTEIESVLQSCKIKKCHSYHVGYIASPEAMEFLERTLNGDSGGVDRLQIQKIVEICGGIPLVFKVVGSYIGASKDKEKAVRKVVEWRDNGKLFSIEKQYKVLESDGLFFAYDDLPEEAKDPFLEICLFFNGWDWDTVECIVGEDEFGSLQKRSLVENKSNRAIIHDVLLAIGRKRTKEFRLTSANDLCELLQNDRKEDVQAIKGIWLQDNEVEPVRILAQQLDGMHNSLRVLALGDTTIVEGKCQNKFQQLIYFQAGKVPNIPFDIARQEELRFLNYRPGVKDTDLLNLSKMPSKLKLIELHGDDISSDPPSFEITSEAVKKLKDLIVLKLDGFRGLKKLPEEIRCLSRLKELDLTGCQCVQLPQSLGDLNALQKIRLDSCGSLKELPQSLGKLQSLKCLELQFCESLTNLPAEIGSLSSLHMLDLSFCQSLKEVPRSFCSLSSLQYLNLMSCVNLLELPHCFGDLKALAVLNLEKCENLTSIPDSFGELTSLQSVSLNMNDCKKLTHLPEGFCKLSYIEDLSLARCYALEKLPQQFLKLVNLRRLNLERCIRLSRLPMGFSDLKSLAVLNLRDCEKLEDLCSDFHRLPSLQTLDLRDCPKLDGKWMESVMKIKTVDFVDIKGSQKLVEKWAEIDQNAGAGSSHLAVSTGKHAEDAEHTPVTRLGAGACAGIIAMSATYPMDMVRGRLTVQTENSPHQYRGMFHALSTVLREEGPKALYKGWLPSVIGVVVPSIALAFVTYELMKDLMGVELRISD